MPKGWDSAFSESHHKGSIKAPSKATQQNQHTLIEQTANRKTEYKNITIAKLHYQTIEQSVPQTNPKKTTGGSHFEIFPDPVTKLPTMKWKSSTNKNKPFFTNDVLKFCCDKILPLQYDKRFVRGFTEHNRADDATGTNYLFRCHPSYRINTGQTIGIWMDWATVLYTEGEGDNLTEYQYPCQIRCLLSIGLLDPSRDEHLVDGLAITEGPHFIGQCFQEEPATITSPVTKLIQRGKLENQLRLCHVDSIVSNVAVVPEFHYDGGLQPTEDYLVIQNRIQWLDYFYQFNRSNGAKSFPELFSAYSCTDQDKAFNKDESENDDNTESESEEDSSEIDTESEEDTTEDDTSDNDTSEDDTSDVPKSDTISTDEDNVSGDV